MASTCRVQVAVYDSPCPSQHLSPFENKIGGYPDFFANCVLNSPPSCKCCGGPLALLAQIYCPHEGSPYHRLLHVYCCCQPACWSKSESWLVLRFQQKDPSYEKEELKSSTSHSVASSKDAAREWCEDLDDWGDELGLSEEAMWNSQDSSDPQRNVTENSVVEISQVEELMKSMTVQEASGLIETSTTPSGTILDEASATDLLTVETKTPPLYQWPYYPASYIAVVEEPEAVSAEDKELLKKYKSDHPTFDFTMDGLAHEQEKRKKESDHRKSGRKENGYSRNGASSGGETYEKSVARHGDKTFQKFYKQLSKCPQQILRYSWKGSPLLFSSSPAHLPPKDSALICKECGAVCVYELQLMPPLVYILHQSLTQAQSMESLDSELALPKEKVVEFGTVLVYSCSASCWEEENPGNIAQLYREEIVVVQPDLDTVDKLHR